MVEQELLWKEGSPGLVVVSSGWDVWPSSIQDPRFLLDLVLPVPFLEENGLASGILGKRGERPQGSQHPVYIHHVIPDFRVVI